MSTLTADTDPRVEAVMIEHLRGMTPGARLHRAFELRAATLVLARIGIRRRHGDIGVREMQIRLAALWLDRQTMQRVFGWDPELEGY